MLIAVIGFPPWLLIFASYLREAAAYRRFAAPGGNGSITSVRSAGCRYAATGDQGERRPCIQPPVVERAAGDGARYDAVLGQQQGLNVRNPGQPARGDDGDGDGARQRGGGRQVEARQHAVAVDVGV